MDRNEPWLVRYSIAKALPDNGAISRRPTGWRAQQRNSRPSLSLLSVSAICSHERRQRLTLFELAQAAGDVDVQIPGLSGEAVVLCHRLEHL